MFPNVVKKALLELQFLGGMKLREDGKEFRLRPKGLLGRLSALTYEVYDGEDKLSWVKYGLLGRIEIGKDGERVLFKPMGSDRFVYMGRIHRVEGKRVSGKFEIHQSGKRLAQGEMKTKYGSIEYSEDFDLGKEVLVGYGIWAMSWYTIMGATAGGGV